MVDSYEMEQGIELEENGVLVEDFAQWAWETGSVPEIIQKLKNFWEYHGDIDIELNNGVVCLIKP